MSMRRRGMVRLARRKAERRLAVFGCMIWGLTSFAMQRVLLHERVVFLLLQPIRRAWALLVPRAHVTGSRHAGSFGLRAFERDDFLGHNLFLAVVPISL